LNKKPAPDIFLSAAAKLGLTPGQCVVVEDAVNGIERPKRQGCAASLWARLFRLTDCNMLIWCAAIFWKYPLRTCSVNQMSAVHQALSRRRRLTIRNSLAPWLCARGDSGRPWDWHQQLP